MKARLAGALTSRENWLILAVLITGAAVWSYRADSPLVDGHAWRQTDTASVALNFYHNGYNLFTRR